MITGTGTQQDPFRPETWEEILECTVTDDVYTQFPLVLGKTADTSIIAGKRYFYANGEEVSEPTASQLDNYYENSFTVDFNDYYPTGVTEEILFRGYIDGRDAKILNVFYDGATCVFRMSNPQNGIIKSLHFINMWIIEAASKEGVWYTSLFRCPGNAYSAPSGRVFEYCSFAGRLESAAVATGGSASEHYRCSYNFELVRGAAIAANRNDGHGVLLTDCDITVHGLDNGTIYCGRPVNSYIHGSMNGIELSGVASNSIIDLSNLTSVSRVNGTPTRILVNLDKYSGGSLRSGFVGVTTSQLMDVSYLQGIGFPIDDGTTGWTMGTDNFPTNVNFIEAPKNVWITPLPFIAWNIDPLVNDGYPYKGVFLDMPESAIEGEGPKALWRIDLDVSDHPYMELPPDIPAFGAFANTNNLAYVKIPVTVQKLGDQVFTNTKLRDVKISPDCTFSDTTFPPGCRVNYYE